MKKPLILLVDDDELFRQTMQQQITELGFNSVAAANGSSANVEISSREFDLILLDLRLPDTDGITLMRKWQDSDISIPMVMISGSGTIPDAVRALKTGALDFIVKPVDLDMLEAVINRSLEAGRLQRENRRLKELVVSEPVEYLGESPKIKEMLEMARKIAATDHPVLLEGETGTGKQILARFVYNSSPRCREPFLSVNCAAISPNLFESEIFGHEKGAFTGAHARKAGKLELVGRGTLFLDEIGELPGECQAKLLTAVEDRVFERVGGVSSLSFEGRIIAATNRDLKAEVSAGNFRKDLYFRLNTFQIKLPPLCEHQDDIPIYINHALQRCRHAYGRDFLPPGGAVLDRLMAYCWHGNVRELIHHVERIALLSKGPRIPDQLWLSALENLDDLTVPETPLELKQALDLFRQRHVQKILAETGGNQTEAAKRLGLGRTYLNRLLASYKENSAGD
jgi:two-component system response regulator AtoC